MNKLQTTFAAIALSLTAFAGHATPSNDAVDHLSHEWAKAYYVTPKDQKNNAFEKLTEEANQAVRDNPGQAGPLIWNAIILSSAAKFDGGLSALGMIKEARERLLQAEKIEPNALDGSVYTSLGSLYAKAPGWPLSFGDKKKADAYLRRALEANPNGIDPNFFYGELLLDRGDKTNARVYLTKALNAPARAGREDADMGRKQEIREALARLGS